MKKHIPLLITTLLLLSACGSSATIGNVGVPGSAKDVSEREIGKNKQLVYMSASKMEEACKEQATLITKAQWTTEMEPTKEDEHVKGEFENGDQELILMCSEQGEPGNFVGTKVTLTLMGGTK